jgi:HAD superfamily hydrolase (TIGR01509 family)
MGALAAVVFDMDGVLVDSEPLHFVAMNTALGTVGESIEEAEFNQFLGTTTDLTLTTLIRRRQLSITLAELLPRYDAALLAALAVPHPPEPGVVDLLASCRRLALRVGLASSSRQLWIAATLRALDLVDAFDVLVGGDDVTRGKPDPEIYLRAASALEVAPTACLAIEDSPNGVRSAAAAGMRVLGVRTSRTLDVPLPGATWIVPSLTAFDLAAVAGA